MIALVFFCSTLLEFSYYFYIKYQSQSMKQLNLGAIFPPKEKKGMKQ
jgi:hypothetical protein